MKKLLLFTFVICMALFTSCTDDSSSGGGGGGGGQTTLKKISEKYYGYTTKCYRSYDYGQTWTLEDVWSNDMSLSQVWNWDENKISSIDYYDNYYGTSQCYSTDRFYYNNNGLVSKIVYTYQGEESESVEFTYNGNQLKVIKYYYHNQLESANEITYTNNKPSRVTCTYMSSDSLSKHNNQFMKNMYNLNTQDLVSCRDLPYTVLTWSGNNLTKWQNYRDGVSYSYATYTYDNKNNPYYGGNSVTTYVVAWDDEFKLSENNVLTELENYDGDIETSTYSYNYFDDFPMQVFKQTEDVYHYDDYWTKYVKNYEYSYVFLDD